MDRWTIGTLLETAAPYLREKGSSSPRLDAELLLAHALGVERINLYMEFDRPLATPEVDRFRSLIARRAGHEPVAYIVGVAHFRHLRLEATPATLIPRPETEELVEAALALLRRRPVLGATRPVVADVGTGSGAIALSIAQEAGLPVLAVDTSMAALEVAARNAAAAGLESVVDFREADLLSGCAEGSLHLVVSNPPYVTTGELAGLSPDIRLFEPVSALDGGRDGLDVIRRLVGEAAQALRPGGSLLLEVGDRQAEAVVGLARDAGFALVQVHRDLSQKERVVEATLPGALVVDPTALGDSELAALDKALRAGGIIGIPTDTVYGIAARWDSKEGVRALFAAKGRLPEQPVAVVFPSVESARQALPDLDDASSEVLAALLPGPYTFVVATRVARPVLVGTADSLGVRVPDHPGVLGLLRSLDTPLAATSANPAGGSDAPTLDEVDPAVLSHCSVVFVEMGEPLAKARNAAPDETSRVTSTPRGPRPASTVVDLRPLSEGGAPMILREGAVAAAEVLARIAALRPVSS